MGTLGLDVGNIKITQDADYSIQLKLILQIAGLANSKSSNGPRCALLDGDDPLPLEIELSEPEPEEERVLQLTEWVRFIGFGS